MLPPHRATLTVSPMERVSRATFAVRTLAYVALRMPSTQTALDMHAPNRNVMPLVASMNREKIAASTTTTMAMVLNSVSRNAVAPERMIPAISTMTSVPSRILRILRKLNRT